MAGTIYNSTILDLRGIDMTTPMDLLTNGHSPYAKNFRLYAQRSDSRQVAVSSAKGPGYYMSPLGETLMTSNVSEVGASTSTIGYINNIHAIKLVASRDERLTRLDVSVGVGTSTQPIIVKIYSDSDGKPYEVLSESSLEQKNMTETPDYVTCRFLNAPLLKEDETYWIVLEQQDNGLGECVVSTTTEGAKAYTSNAGVGSLVETTYAINYKLYTTPSAGCKGAFRFNVDGGTNKTLVVYGTTMYCLNESTLVLTPIATGLSASATYYSFDSGDGKVFWVNGYDDLKCWDGTDVTTITDTELPKLSLIAFYKDRLFGRSAVDPNKIVFSEAPGNPSNVAANLQWYNAWLSTSFIYAPKPYNGSPVTGMVPFQDSLHVFTQDKKYVISGYSNETFSLRESIGSKGALSNRGIVIDENDIYFASSDGIYRFNGSSDVKISLPVDPLYNECPLKESITPVLWNNKIRVYMATAGSSINNICVIFNKDLGEWEQDTGIYIDRAICYTDADDDNELIEISSQYPCMFLAEQYYSKLGAAIDFEYRFPYMSFGAPGQRKRMIRFVPIIQGVDSSYIVKVGMDKDFTDAPRIKDYQVIVGGNILGEFDLDSGFILGSDRTLKPRRVSFPGNAYYWQPRVMRRAVGNVVSLVGAQLSYKAKRL